MFDTNSRSLSYLYAKQHDIPFSTLKSPGVKSLTKGLFINSWSELSISTCSTVENNDVFFKIWASWILQGNPVLLLGKPRFVRTSALVLPVYFCVRK